MEQGLIEKIKDKVSCVDYMLREHGAHLHKGRCVSFRPGADNASSLMVNDRDWYDFGSSLGGDIIDMCAHDKFEGDKGSAIRYLAEKWGIGMTEYSAHIDVVYRSYLGILDEASKFYHDNLDAEHRGYLHMRGITDDTIDALRIGWAVNPCPHLRKLGYSQNEINKTGLPTFINRLMIPYMRNDKAVYFIGRSSVWDQWQSNNPNAKYMKLHRGEISEHPIWGIDTLKRRTGKVIIAEGIFDAMSCWQEGYPVITAVTGAFSAEQKKDLIPALKGRNVVICMDYDPETKAGQKFTAKLASELFSHGINISVVFLTGDAEKQDISEIYASNPKKSTLEKIFSQAVPWGNFMMNYIASIREPNERMDALYEFLRNASIAFPWPVVAQMGKDASALEHEGQPAFPEAWLKETMRTLQKAPAEEVICEQFRKKYDCIYQPRMGFYEYNGSVWEPVEDLEIARRCGSLYGRFKTFRLMDSACKALKILLMRDKPFNTDKNLLNFPNGMLDIETGKLRAHSRTYYSNVQMTYRFDTSATCPRWKQFIDEVTNGDEKRKLLIQQMFGYCLTKDARYQKCFCLMGDGANGKSVLLSILEAMVGSPNTSHVEIAFFNSEFQRIKLMDSMVNICADMTTDVRGTEAYLKTIVAGERISACFKGKDFIDFVPYCKMVFASNHTITARDVDKALLRRFQFIDFPVSFVDRPVADNERKKIPNIESTLLPELPGILNWALIGLSILREDDTFVITDEQKQRSYDLLAQNDPIVSFIDDVVGNGDIKWDGWISREDVFAEYVKWCDRTASRVMSARAFWPKMRQSYPFEEKWQGRLRTVKFKHKK